MLALIGAGYAAVDIWPDLGAQSADVLRDVVGDQVVAQLETIVFDTLDRIHSWSYQLGGTQPAAPWAVAETHTVVPAVAPTLAAVPALAAPAAAPPRARRAPSLPPATAPGATADRSPPPAWSLARLPASGTLAGVGQWSAYLYDSAGQTVAYRTFVQPDPERPYAVAAVVAFDLQAVRLHFVLGSEEPRSLVAIRRTGAIPAADLHSGLLLAAFNGGFKARHGHFGAMVDGVAVLPPKDGLGTVGIYQDGRLRIGAWGADIRSAPTLSAWRQNGPLVIQHGQINPHTADIQSPDWGIILNGVTAVWRSALGISADGRTLYYLAGNSLTLPALTRGLALIGAEDAIQLDINIGMVHFDAIQATPTGLTPLPLFEAMKGQRDDRYIQGDKRDYFYVTINAA
jgi:hypothetical protein